MENKINVAELLKDCPSGLELYSPLFGDCKFVKVHDHEARIIVKLETGATVSFQTDGRYYDYPNAECILFPSKDKTTWEGFQRPFKDGDILVSGLGDCEEIPFIFKQTNRFSNAECYCAVNCYGELIFNSDNWTYIKGCRLATEEEKAKLFQVIKDNGYYWNVETKTLEKLVKPKFKKGDIIQDKDGYKVRITNVSIEDECYGYESLTVNGIGGISFNIQDKWELVPDKFDVINFEPFMKVLVRSDNSDVWECDFFSSYNPKCSNRFHCIGIWSSICIPYIGNEHLRGTTNDCDDFYKTWE